MRDFFGRSLLDLSQSAEVSYQPQLNYRNEDYIDFVPIRIGRIVGIFLKLNVHCSKIIPKCNLPQLKTPLYIQLTSQRHGIQKQQISGCLNWPFRIESVTIPCNNRTEHSPGDNYRPSGKRGREIK